LANTTTTGASVDGVGAGGQNGTAGKLYGGGGTAGNNTQNKATARSGGNGGAGIVIVELYA
jgi:hypothetical protein